MDAVGEVSGQHLLTGRCRRQFPQQQC